MKMAGNSTVTGVEVITWASDPSAGNGMLHYVDTNLFGGNVGHAAIRLTIPANEEGRKLVEQYCNGALKIPYELKTVSTPLASSEINDTHADQQHAFEEPVYEIYFSYWPTTLQNHEDDRESEAKGVNKKFGEAWKDSLYVENRSIKGSAGERVITMGPNRVVHIKQVNEAEMQQIQLNERKIVVSREFETLQLLEQKLDEALDTQKGDKIRFSTTMNLIIDKYAADFKEQLDPKQVVFDKNGSIQSISREAADQLMSTVSDKIYDRIHEKRKIDETLDPAIIEELIADRKIEISQGANPDNIVRIPITTGPSANPNALDPEKMLKQMRTLVDKGGFDMFEHNCSSTVDSVLEAGCNDPKLKQAFRQTAMGYFKNPQEAFKHATQFQHELSQNKKPKGTMANINSWIKKNNPITNTARKLFKTAMTDESSGVMKGLANVGLVGLGIVNTPIFLLQKIANPAKTVNDINRFRDYANNRSSTFLKVVANVVAAPTMLALGAPALIQNAINNNIVKPLQSKKAIEKSKEKVNQLRKLENEIENDHNKRISGEEKESAIDKELSKMAYSELFKEAMQQKSVNITEKDPKKALAQFQEVIAQSPDKIPVFDNDTQMKVGQYLNKVKDPDVVKQYNADSQAAMTRVAAIEKSVQETDGFSPELQDKISQAFEKLTAEYGNSNFEHDSPPRRTAKPNATASGTPPPLPPKSTNATPPPLPAKTAANGYNTPPPLPPKTAASATPPPLPAKTPASGYNITSPPLPPKTAASPTPPPLPAKTAASGYITPPPLPAKTAASGYITPPPLPAKTSANDYIPPVPPPLPPKTADSGYTTPSQTSAVKPTQCETPVTFSYSLQRKQAEPLKKARVFDEPTAKLDAPVQPKGKMK